MAKQTAIQESQVQKQRFLKNLFIVGCFFFIVTIVFLVYTNNLKKRKNAELADSLEKLKSTQEQLIRHEKLASMGKLSAGIAHEIRNPINFITNFSELSEELLTELSEAESKEEREELISGLKDSMGKIKFHGMRADGIIKSMLDHSRSKSPEKELCNINSLVERNLSMAFNAIRVQNPSFQCKVQNNLAQDLADVKIVAADIGRVLLNIFTNAFQAMDEKKISAGPDYSPLLSISTFSKNGKIVLFIRDNGVGIPEQEKDMIFEPFFTTKPSGQGTGLGLSISNEIIKSHNGEMVVESIQNEFTQFTITLG
ncbi:MAG: GHKL domain-containing protein [Bacteroidetes bacterium]|nr:GHKL domain-containing protein [Bacteroidota bacterium]